MNATSKLPPLHFTADGEGVASHAGARLLAELAERLGLTEVLSVAMAPTRQRRSAHDPAKVLMDLAVALAGGADCLSDLATLRHQEALFGRVASDPTAWRVLDAVDKQRLIAIGEARAQARARAWAAGVRPERIVLDLDATLITSHSEKDHAAPTPSVSTLLSKNLRPAGLSTSVEEVDLQQPWS